MVCCDTILVWNSMGSTKNTLLEKLLRQHQNKDSSRSKSSSFELVAEIAQNINTQRSKNFTQDTTSMMCCFGAAPLPLKNIIITPLTDCFQTSELASSSIRKYNREHWSWAMIYCEHIALSTLQCNYISHKPSVTFYILITSDWLHLNY